MSIALSGLLVARAIPPAPPSGKRVAIGWNLVRETGRILSHARRDRVIWRSVLGISWFWMVGLVLLTQFPVVAKDVLGGDSALVTLLLTGFTAGVGVGSILCPLLLRGEVSALSLIHI